MNTTEADVSFHSPAKPFTFATEDLMHLNNGVNPQIRAAIDQLEGPKPMDVRLMKKRTGEAYVPRMFLPHKQTCVRWANLLPLKGLLP